MGLGIAAAYLTGLALAVRAALVASELVGRLSGTLAALFFLLAIGFVLEAIWRVPLLRAEASRGRL